MKIQIEFKDKKYTISFGKLSGIGSTLKEARENLVNAFRVDIEKFFGGE